MTEVDLFEEQNDSYDVLELSGPYALIRCHGNVKLNKIVCASTMENLFIEGDSLTVNNNDYDVAIGVGPKSYPNYYQVNSDAKIQFCISVTEIHAYSGVEGCGIGVYGVRSISSDEFTDSCIIRDTPIDMVVTLPDASSSSTKLHKAPYYRTKDVLAIEKALFTEQLNQKLMQSKASDKIAGSFSNYLRLKEDGKLGNDCANEMKIIQNVDNIMSKVTEQNFAATLQVMYASMIKSMECTNYKVRMAMEPIFVLIGYKFLCKEVQLFDKVAKLPLSLRYLNVLRDYHAYKTISTKEISSCADFGELRLNDRLVSHYKHPVDRSYSKEMHRYFYGSDVYFWKDSFNTLVVPNIVKSDYDTISADCMLVTNNDFFSSLFSSDYADDKGMVWGIIADETGTSLIIKSVPVEEIETNRDNIAIVGNKIIVDACWECLCDLT